MGCPIAIGFPFSTALTADQMVVSVGPYMFHSEAHLGSNSSANCRGHASPPHRIFKWGLPCHPESSSSLHVERVACITVASLRCINAASSLPSLFVEIGRA